MFSRIVWRTPHLHPHSTGGSLAEHLALFPVAGQVEEVDLIDSLEVSMVGKFPDDALVSSHFKGLGLFAHKFAGEIVADDGVTVRQTLATGWQAQWVSRQ